VLQIASRRLFVFPLVPCILSITTEGITVLKLLLQLLQHHPNVILLSSSVAKTEKSVAVLVVRRHHGQRLLVELVLVSLFFLSLQDIFVAITEDVLRSHSCCH